MRLLYKDEFTEMKFNEITGIHYHILYDSTIRMTDERFRYMLLVWLQTTRNTNATKALVDTRDLQFPISPKLQEWVAKEVVAISPVMKSAFIVPIAMIENLSIAQYIDEANAAGQKAEGYFATIEAAEAWLIVD